MTLPPPTIRLDPVPTREETTAPGLRELFLAFLGVGLMGFGGVLPLARIMVVEKRRWLTAREFTDLLALCQFLPGGNILNMAVAIGLRFRGWIGAIVALVGLLAAPTAIAIALAAIFQRYQDVPVVRRLFAGLAAAAAGLIIAMALKIAEPLRRQPIGIGLAALAFLAIAVLRLPLLPTMLVMAPASMLILWWRGA
jgi:chromate transporter